MNGDGGQTVSCCGRVRVDGQILSDKYCTTCKNTEPPSKCGPREILMDSEQY